MAKTRSSQQEAPADTEKVRLGGGSRDLARGRTRSGTLFTRQSRGHYDNLADLRRAHPKLFSLEPTFCLLERPISGRAGGLAQACLRVNDKSTNVSKTLVRAAAILFRLYPDSVVHAQVTANVVLRSDKDNSLSVYYGQRFGPDSKQVNLGQEFDDDGAEVRPAPAFELRGPADAARLPTRFSAQHFGDLFSRNFGNSEVHVHSVLNLVYVFSKGLDDYDAEKTTGQAWVDLF